MLLTVLYLPCVEVTLIVTRRDRNGLMSYTDLEIPDSLLWKRQGNRHEDIAAEWLASDVDQTSPSHEVESEWDATGTTGGSAEALAHYD